MRSSNRVAALVRAVMCLTLLASATSAPASPTSGVLHVPLAAPPIAGATPSTDGHSGLATPIGVVSAMLEGFAQRSERHYVRWMTDDYVFWSDEPGFARRFPTGLARSDEAAFAAHLFEGGAHGPDGRALPVAVRVTQGMGAVTLIPLSAGPAQARLVLHDLHARLELADGTTLEVGDSQNVIDLVLTESGWRVSRWIETHGPAEDADRLATRLGPATSEPLEYGRLLRPRAGRPRAWQPRDSVTAWRREQE